jgi:hypothetical protein
VRRGLLEGDADPRVRRSLLEVSTLPRIGTEPTRGRCVPSSEAEPARGGLEWAALVGRQGHRGGPCLCVFNRDMFSLGFLQVLDGVSPVV